MIRNRRYQLLTELGAPSYCPFVKTLPTSGKIGSKVTILGPNSAVMSNGTPVTSFIGSSMGSAILTTVPKGATTEMSRLSRPMAR